MKKIILASNSEGITFWKMDMFGLAKDKVKWAYITTAGNDVPDDSYLIRTKKQLDDLGWNYEEMDITDKNEDEVYEMLKDKDAIFMQGGNTFYLLKQALACNFSRVLDKLLAEGKIYVGASAGSYIMCPNIEMSNWKETDKFNRHGLTDLTALAKVPFQVFCHFNRYTDEQRASIKENAKKSPYKVYFLEDGQAIQIEDDNITLIK